MKMIVSFVAIAAFGLAACSNGQGGPYYVTPIGVDGGNGSKGSPWLSFDSAFKTGKLKRGDRLVVPSGRYPNVVIRHATPDFPVSITPADGGAVTFSSLVIANSRNLVISGLRFVPGDGAPPSALIITYPNSSDIAFSEITMLGHSDAANYENWTMEEWTRRKVSGAILRGPRTSIVNSSATAVNFGISISGSDSRAENNAISGFSGDGMHVVGDNSVLRGNIIKDCVQIDRNHADGIQSWSIGPDRRAGAGTVTNVTIDQNHIFEWTRKTRPNFTCSLQGIGLFDGTYRNFTITRNIVATSAYHGIALTGGEDSVIAQNTVVNLDRKAPPKSWIGVFPHKNGRPSTNVRVEGNVAPRFGGTIGNVSGRDGNILVTRPEKAFVDADRLDFRPLANGPLMKARKGENAKPSGALGPEDR